MVSAPESICARISDAKFFGSLASKKPENLKPKVFNNFAISGEPLQLTPSKPASLTAWNFFSTVHSAAADGCSTKVHKLAIKTIRGRGGLVMVGLELRLQAATTRHADRLKAELRSRGINCITLFRGGLVFQRARAHVLLLVEPGDIRGVVGKTLDADLFDH